MLSLRLRSTVLSDSRLRRRFSEARSCFSCGLFATAVPFWRVDEVGEERGLWLDVRGDVDTAVLRANPSRPFGRLVPAEHSRVGE